MLFSMIESKLTLTKTEKCHWNKEQEERNKKTCKEQRPKEKNMNIALNSSESLCVENEKKMFAKMLFYNILIGLIINSFFSIKTTQ